MVDAISSWWAYEARIFPLVLSVSLFSAFHFLRKITRVEYTPSYFAIFPLSMLNAQLSEYFDEFYGGAYESVQEGRRKNPRLFIKAWISMFMTFLMVPLVTGFVVAFILTPHEFTAFLVLLLAFEGRHCYKAVINFGRYRGDWKSVLKFFVPFYAIYLFTLWLVVRQSYHFTAPFVESRDYSLLASAIETTLGPIIIQVLALGIVTNLLAHWLVNKDAIEPTSFSDYE